MNVWKPEGCPSIITNLIAQDAEALIAFIEKACDGALLRHVNRPDGLLVPAEMRIDYDFAAESKTPSGTMWWFASQPLLKAEGARNPFRARWTNGARFTNHSASSSSSNMQSAPACQ